jgi:predicted nucleic acid-binding protein
MNGNEKEPRHSPVVSNSGPLIALATINKLDLLKDLFGQVCIPQAVYDEVVVYGEGKPGAQETDEAEWIKILEVKDRLAISLLREEMDAGESEAIILAQELNAAYVLIDEAIARRKVRLIGLCMVGTLGLLLMAKEAGLTSAVKPALDELRQTDFRMSSRLYREVLVKAGEA